MNYLSPLLTDYYQLTMAYGYWQLQRAEVEAVFQLTFRTNPFKGNGIISAGLSRVIEYLNNYRFTNADLQYLRSLSSPHGEKVFSENFLNYLSRLEFSCDVDAVTEGSIAFPQEPLLRIRGPLLQCQLLETPLINLINFPSLIATRTAQICHIANSPVIEFGLRRAQGPDGALTASYAAYLGGCEATSNVIAGQRYDIPVKGTMAHSWVMSYPDELTAFREFVKITPVTILLVDTYDTIQGVTNAIQVGKELRAAGRDLLAVRLDSGDLLALSKKTRHLLDSHGFTTTKILASGDLTAEKIAALKSQQAPIDSWGVGTKLVTAYEQPALDMIYKLTAIHTPEGWEYKAKTSDSPQKRTYPGIHQVRRYFQNERILQDVIYDLHGAPPSPKLTGATAEHDLLQPIFRQGKLIYQMPTIHRSREQSIKNMTSFLSHALPQIDMRIDECPDRAV